MFTLQLLIAILLYLQNLKLIPVMKKSCFVFLVLFNCFFSYSKSGNIEYFDLQNVKLLPSVFKEAESVDTKYIMALDPDRLLAPFRREAGLSPKAESYSNWENSGLDGHMGGHYLTALSLMYASTGEKRLKKRLEYVINELYECQAKSANGYIGGVPNGEMLWKEVAEGKLDVGAFSINGKWVPLYNIHKTYAGLRDAWIYAGNIKAKEMLIRFTNWMILETSKLSDNQIQYLLDSEHGGLNEVFADVYELTNDKRYLKLAYQFSHQKILTALEHSKDCFNGMHANTQIPKVIGFERIAELANDSLLHQAALYFWDNVINHRSCAIGGNSVREHFHPVNNFSSMITSEQGPESCNTYNMLKLTKMLYSVDGSERYIDYYERALYNHILSTQHPVKGGFVYFTPMRPGHYKVYSQVNTSMWCCVGTGMESHAKYGEMIYAHNSDQLFVNLFIPSELNWKEKKIKLVQTTNFPEEESVAIRIEVKKRSEFTLQLRYPIWVKAHALSISINGEAISISTNPGNYIAIKRVWKDGDIVKMNLPMETKAERLPDGSNYYAILHGPIVLAAKTDTLAMRGLFADDSRGGHIASGKQIPLQDIPMFIAKDSNFANNIVQENKARMVFKASSIISPKKYSDLELIPFYRLHDSRYIIYWQVETEETVVEMKAKLAAKEFENQELINSTIDLVNCGEQQPESDHFIESDHSNSGVNGDRHWRDATGWFSYQLHDKDLEADRIRITYFGGDKNRRFNLIVNNHLVTRVLLDGSKGPLFYTEDYLVPKEWIVQTKGKLIVKFQAEEGSVAGGIYEVRLLRK